MAEILGIGPMQVMAANSFYDMCRSRCGCTAFAVDHERGPLHSQCLDWDIGREVLTSHAACFSFNQDGRTAFRSVGWPGFLGTFAGVAPGKFAVTLNAVWSEDEPNGANPIGFVIRQALTEMANFVEAVEFLSMASIRCDGLLLVSGTRKGEMAVIERTPAQHAVQRATSELMLVTNHYCNINAGSNMPGYVPSGREPFGERSRERHAAALARLSERLPTAVDCCFSLLSEEPFCHAITIQRLVMRASTGQLLAGRLNVETNGALYQSETSAT